MVPVVQNFKQLAFPGTIAQLPRRPGWRGNWAREPFIESNNTLRIMGRTAPFILRGHLQLLWFPHSEIFLFWEGDTKLLQHMPGIFVKDAIVIQESSNGLIEQLRL